MPSCRVSELSLGFVRVWEDHVNEIISPLLTVPAGGEAVHQSTDSEEKAPKAKVKVKARLHRKQNAD